MEMDFTLSNVVCQIEHPLDTITIVAISHRTALDIVLVQMPKWRMARMPAILKKGIDSYSAASVGETQPLLNSKTPTHPEEPAYLSLKELDKNKGKLNWPLFFFHRFWRLTPLYMMVIFFNISIEQYMGSGPNWFDRDKSREACEENWWTNLLYINNLVNLDKRCLGESWYLANDMQFYLLSPLIFVPFYYSPYLGGLSSLAFLLATTISPGVITSELHFTAGSAKLAEKTVAGANSFNDYYIKPYCRMGPYVVGLVAGYILYKYASRIRMNRIVAPVRAGQ
nr:hypothetical protein BaRGS_005751 [Batillaria attramentaria]